MEIRPVKAICPDCANEKKDAVIGCIDTITNFCTGCFSPEDCEARKSTYTTLLYCQEHYRERFVVLKGTQTRFTFKEVVWTRN